jgi:hypothetical protein
MPRQDRLPRQVFEERGTCGVATVANKARARSPRRAAPAGGQACRSGDQVAARVCACQAVSASACRATARAGPGQRPGTDRFAQRSSLSRAPKRKPTRAPARPKNLPSERRTIRLGAVGAGQGSHTLFGGRVAKSLVDHQPAAAPLQLCGRIEQALRGSVPSGCWDCRARRSASPWPVRAPAWHFAGGATCGRRVPRPAGALRRSASGRRRRPAETAPADTGSLPASPAGEQIAIVAVIGGSGRFEPVVVFRQAAPAIGSIAGTGIGFRVDAGRQIEPVGQRDTPPCGGKYAGGHRAQAAAVLKHAAQPPGKQCQPQAHRLAHQRQRALDIARLWPAGLRQAAAALRAGRDRPPGRPARDPGCRRRRPSPGRRSGFPARRLLAPAAQRAARIAEQRVGQRRQPGR